MKFQDRIRVRDVFVSCLMFTVALISFVPSAWENAATWRHGTYQTSERIWADNYLAPVGFASLAVIWIGLIVTWTGYLNRSRVAWFVMFIVVWIWAFPVYILPLVPHFRNSVSIAQWLSEALEHAGIERNYLRLYLTFALLVLAPLISLKSFLSGRGPRSIPPRV